VVDIFEEVDEELRNDEYQVLLRKYGPWVLGGAVAIVAGTAAYQGWSAWRTSQIETSSNAFIVAQEHYDEGRLPLAAASFETLAGNATAGYATLSLLQRAAIALEDGDSEVAAQFFDQAAASSSDPLISDLAELKSVWARWETLSSSDVEIRLSPLTQTQSPYRYLARESIAAAALRAGEYDTAEGIYQLLSLDTGDKPARVRQRAMEALALLEQINANAPEASTDEASAVEAGAVEALADDATTDETSTEETSTEEANAVETSDDEPTAGEAGDD
jgi:hypothetical protein